MEVVIVEEKRKIPLKNYIILLVIVIATILLLHYFYRWFEVYNDTKLNRPILDKYMEVINYNELDNYLIENPNTIIYVSVLEDAEIRNFEKKFKDVFKNGEIENNILYLDITNDIKDKKNKEKMEKKYSINSISILDVPLIMVIDNGELKSINTISSVNYDIERIKNLINGIVFSEEEKING